MARTHALDKIMAERKAAAQQPKPEPPKAEEQPKRKPGRPRKQLAASQGVI